MLKQLFYLVGIVVLMIVAYRLMKKVDAVPPEKRNKSPEEWRQNIADLEEQLSEEQEKTDDYGLKSKDETEE